ncbi:MAG: hypothetical protein GY730_01155 [bacterium]|nr:hypothetical protein [bacterium]
MGLIPVIKRKRDPLAILLMLFAFSLSLWVLAGIVIELFVELNKNPIFFTKTSMAVVTFAAAFLFLFCIQFVYEKIDKRIKFILLILLTVSTSFSFSGLYIKDIRIENNIAIREIASLFPFFGVLLLFFILAGPFLVAVKINTYEKNKKNQARTIISAFVTGALWSFLFGVILPASGINQLFFLSHLGAFIMCFLLSFAITKYELMDLRIFVSRGIAYLMVIGIIGAFWGIINFEFSNKGFVLVANGLLLAICFLFADKLRNSLQTIKFEEVSEIFSKDFEKCSSLQGLYSALDCLFGITIQVYPISLYIPDNFEDQSQELTVFEKWTTKRKSENNHRTINKDSFLISCCIKENKVLFYKEAGDDIKKEMDNLDADCIIPCISGEILLSLIVISKHKYIPDGSQKPVQVKYSSTDKMLFNLISKQMVIVLNRLRPFEKLQVDYEKSLKIAKQASMYKAFSEFTKKVHHEIKNPLYS